MIWRWFFPPLSLIIWATLTYLTTTFWFEARGVQQSLWALALVAWLVATPYLAIFVCCVLTITSLDGSFPQLAEVYAKVSVGLTRACVLPEAIVDRLGIGSIFSFTSIPWSLYANALLLNGKIKDANRIAQESYSRICKYGTNAQKASSLVDLANMLFYAGDLLKARQELTNALKFMEQEPKNVAWLLQQEKICRGIGDLHNACHDFPAAVKAYQISIKSMEEVIAKTKSTTMIKAFEPILVLTYCDLATVYVWTGDLVSADDCFRKIEDKGRSGFAKTTNYLELLSQAELKIRQLKFTEAESAIVEATKITERLGELASISSLRVRARFELATRNLSQAQKTLEKAEVLTKKFFEPSHPLNLDLLELQKEIFTQLNDSKQSEDFKNQYEKLKRSSQDNLYGRPSIDRDVA